MNPLIISTLALLFVILAIATVFIMLEITGRTGGHGDKKRWIYTHKTLGYLFLVLFMVMLSLMIPKAAGIQEELSSRIVVHIALALALIILVIVKMMIARRYPRHSSKLPLLGVIILTFSFVLTGVSAGHYVLHRSSLTYTTLTVLQNKVIINPKAEIGRILVSQKCNICHSLDRVYGASKSYQEWVSTVNRMITIRDDPDFLSEAETLDIVNFLSRRNEENQKNQH